VTKLAGWGIPPSLPPAIRMRMEQADAQERLADKEAEEQQEARREELRQRNLGLYAAQAAARGELISAVALAQGRVSGRTVTEILDAGRMAGDQEDVVAAARAHREGHGVPEPLHIEVGEPVLLQARSAIGRKIFNRARHFADLMAARRELVAAEKAAVASRNDYGLVEGVTLHRRSEV
jgi:hypothetical protein